MKLLHFVSAASVILAGWLAVTFVYHVPAQRYLKLEKYSTVSASEHKTIGVAVAAGTHPAVFQVSSSR